MDQAVISEIASRHASQPSVVGQVDLTQPFHAKSQWTLVVADESDTITGEDDLG